MNRSRYLAILMIALFTSVSFVCFNSFGQGKTKTQAEGSIGAEACKGCHPDLYDGLKNEPDHFAKGCEACHGPGAKHAEAEGKGFIFSFKDKNAKTRSDACLACHEKQKSFFQFARGVHKLSAVGCNDCHRIHGTQIAKHLLKAKENDLCFSCHLDIKAKFYLPNNHRVIQGAIKCTDCHTPHGTRARASLKKWNKFNDDVCFNCHPEKRGPWVFEHASVKAEGCTICHAPHGSPNRFLLIRRDVRTVCLECHGQRHFPKFSCVNCHTQIHGSNFSSRFFQ
jgi:DmsE family decaheme c-type cytochrome